MTTRVAVHGTGRMAMAIVEAAGRLESFSLVALAGPVPPERKMKVPWVPSLDELPAQPDVLIDFTLPDGTLTAANWCKSSATPLVSGVTGLSDEVHSALAAASQSAPVLWSPNLSFGVNLLADLAARTAVAVDPDVPVRIEDIHHQWKKDAPSGTALMLGGRIAQQRGGDDGGLEYRSVREGEVIGVHSIRFSLAGEEIELVHRASDRSIYATGALRAAAWLCARAPGLYSAADWLADR
jgi:4-hydroxy-tetrahydrodipicolinate reductase